MDYSQLHATIKECAQDLAMLNLKVPSITTYTLSSRMTRALGNCKFRSSKVRGVFSISISISRDLPHGFIGRNTVMHEMLHAIAGAECGHGGEWARLARLVSREFSGKYKITMYADKDIATELTTIRQATRSGYRVACLTCGGTHFVTSRHGITKNPQNYRCACGGSFKVTRV